MSDFIACVGCGATIHKTAPTCPKCGAPQASTTKTTANVVTATTLSDYAAVPWFRRRWFIAICIATLTPIASIIALTGEIFYDSKGAVKQLPKNYRLGIMIASLAWVAMIFGSRSSSMVPSIGLTVMALIVAFKK